MRKYLLVFLAQWKQIVRGWRKHALPFCSERWARATGKYIVIVDALGWALFAVFSFQMVLPGKASVATPQQAPHGLFTLQILLSTFSSPLLWFFPLDPLFPKQHSSKVLSMSDNSDI
jgi:hypothetical protein